MTIRAVLFDIDGALADGKDVRLALNPLKGAGEIALYDDAAALLAGFDGSPLGGPAR